MRKLPILAAAAFLALPVAAEPPAKQFSKTLPLAAGERVRVDTYKGSVKVSVWDRAEVAVDVKVVADPECGSSSQQARWVDQTNVTIERTSAGVSVVSDYDKLDEVTSWFSGCTARPFVHYVIQMPRTTPLRIKDYKSDLAVSGLAAGLHVETYKGRLDVEGLDGSFHVETYKGEVKASLVRLAGDVRAETYKGTITVLLPSASAFELQAESGRGTLDVEFPAPLTGRGGHRRGLVASGSVNGGGPRVSLKTEKGTIALRKA
jgi:hypothetical protein